MIHKIQAVSLITIVILFILSSVLLIKYKDSFSYAANCLNTVPIGSVFSCMNDSAGSSGSSDNQAACLARGGEWRSAGGRPGYLCFVRAKDANKLCSGSSECDGDCLVAPDSYSGNEPIIGKKVNGRCSEYTFVMGCHGTVENGIAQPIMCAD